LRFTVDSALRAVSTAREFNMVTNRVPAFSPVYDPHAHNTLRYGLGAQHRRTNLLGLMDFE
jgi:hypothetical protein